MSRTRSASSDDMPRQRVPTDMAPSWSAWKAREVRLARSSMMFSRRWAMPREMDIVDGWMEWAVLFLYGRVEGRR